MRDTFDNIEVTEGRLDPPRLGLSPDLHCNLRPSNYPLSEQLAMAKIEDTLEAWNRLDSHELIQTVFREYGARAAIGTSFQKTGTVTIDIASRVANNFRVYTIDTERLFPETYAYIEELERRYGLKLESYKPDEATTQSMIKRHGGHLFYKSKELQDYCCHVRKVVPNYQALKTLDVWITGLRKDQSHHRSQLGKTQVIAFEGREIIKVAPLFDWSQEQVDEYVLERELPVHPLYSKSLEAGQVYKSIGCHTCTVPVLPDEGAREGRWPWQRDDDKKECGLQLIGGLGI